MSSHNEHIEKVGNGTIIEEVLLEASRIVEVRIAQFRAVLALLLLIFNLQWQMQTSSATPKAFFSLGLAVSLFALGFSAFVITSYKRKRTLSVTPLAITSIGLDATLMVLPVSLYFTAPQALVANPSETSSLLNQPTVFAMYLLVIASGLRFRKVAYLGILVNSLVVLSLMLMEAFASRLFESHDPVSSLAIKQHVLLLLCSAMLAWLISTQVRVTTQKAATAVLHSTTDPLTGVYNRHYLRQQLESLCGRKDCSVHLIMVDADHFKSINDTLGHPCGDRVLIEIAKRLQATLRPTDILARYGGEEFCVVIPNVNDIVAIALAERLRKAVLNSPIEERKVTVSIGLSRKSENEPISLLIERADQALYRSKEGGRNQVQAEWPEGNLKPEPDTGELVSS